MLAAEQFLLGLLPASDITRRPFQLGQCAAHSSKQGSASRLPRFRPAIRRTGQARRAALLGGSLARPGETPDAPSESRRQRLLMMARTMRIAARIVEENVWKAKQ